METEAYVIQPDVAQGAENSSGSGKCKTVYWQSPRSVSRRTRGGSPTLATCFLCGARTVLSGRSPCRRLLILDEVKPPTGEPYAGNPLARFGGRGSWCNRLSLPPIPILSVVGCSFQTGMLYNIEYEQKGENT